MLASNLIPRSPAKTTPAHFQTQVTGINNAGTTVGFYADSNGATAPNFFGFVGQNGVFTRVNDPNTPAAGPTTNQLLGVNDNGHAAGFYTDGQGNDHGYLYDIGSRTFNGVVTSAFLDISGNFTNFEATSSTNTMFPGINNNGDVAGAYQDAQGFNHGFIYAIATLNGINDNGQLVGFYGNAAGNTIGLMAYPVPEPATLALVSLGALLIGERQGNWRSRAV